MSHLAPDGQVYQAGTLSGNPLAVAAGRKTLEILNRRGVYENLDALGQQLQTGLQNAADQNDIPVQINRVGSVLTLFFTQSPVTDYKSAKLADTSRYARFFQGMRKQGVWLAPSQFEAMFLSTAHTSAEIDEIVAKAAKLWRVCN